MKNCHNQKHNPILMLVLVITMIFVSTACSSSASPHTANEVRAMLNSKYESDFTLISESKNGNIANNSNTSNQSDQTATIPRYTYVFADADGIQFSVQATYIHATNTKVTVEDYLTQYVTSKQKDIFKDNSKITFIDGNFCIFVNNHSEIKNAVAYMITQLVEQNYLPQQIEKNELTSNPVTLGIYAKDTNGNPIKLYDFALMTKQQHVEPDEDKAFTTAEKNYISAVKAGTISETLSADLLSKYPVLNLTIAFADGKTLKTFNYNSDSKLYYLDSLNALHVTRREDNSKLYQLKDEYFGEVVKMLNGTFTITDDKAEWQIGKDKWTAVVSEKDIIYTKNSTPLTLSDFKISNRPVFTTADFEQLFNVKIAIDLTTDSATIK